MARRTVLLLALAATTGFMPAPAQAQTSSPIGRGSWIIGGSARAVHLHDAVNDKSEYGFELLPVVGAFIVRGLSITGDLRLGWSRRESVGSTWVTGIGPGITYYVPAVARHLYPFGSFRVLRTWTSFHPEQDAGIPKVTDRTWTWTAGIGVVLFVARNVGLTGEAFYSRFSVASDVGASPNAGRNHSDEYGVQFGIRAFVF
jgi:hypothetical protein